MSNLYKTLYVSQLPQRTQQAILTDIKLALSQLNLSHHEYNIALNNAINSRLSDISDLINIDEYKNDITRRLSND